MSLRFLPNLLCVIRMLLVYPVAHGIMLGHYPQVLAIFAVAAFTDGLDGFLAKRFGWTSDLGKHLDPLADKLLLVTVFVCLSLANLAPWWLTATVLLRDLLIVAGAIAYRVLLGQIHGQPSRPSKVNTFCQIVFCLAAVAEAAFAWPTQATITALGALVLVTTAVSGLDYILVYSRRAISAAHARSAA
jgi:cardiolipin synthase (CMP-forming)